MVHRNTDALFPIRALPALRGLRSAPWDELVAFVEAQPSGSPEQLAFVLMIARLASCQNCDWDSYRAFQGCSECAAAAVRRFRGDDEALKKLFNAAQKEVHLFLSEDK